MVAFGDPPGPNLEGWAGVDIATMTITGESATAVPEPKPYDILLVGLALVGFAARRRRPNASSVSWSVR